MKRVTVRRWIMAGLVVGLAAGPSVSVRADDRDAGGDAGIAVSGTNWYWKSTDTITSADAVTGGAGLGTADDALGLAQLLSGIPEGDVGVSYQAFDDPDAPSMAAAVILSTRRLQTDPTRATITLTVDPEATRNPATLPVLRACPTTDYVNPDPGPSDDTEAPGIHTDACTDAEPSDGTYTFDLTDIVRTWRTDPTLPTVVLVVPNPEEAVPYTLALHGGREGVAATARTAPGPETPTTTGPPHSPTTPPATTGQTFTPTTPSFGADVPPPRPPETPGAVTEPDTVTPELASPRPVAVPRIPGARFNTALWLAGLCLLLSLTGLRRGASVALTPERALFLERLRARVGN